MKMRVVKQFDRIPQLIGEMRTKASLAVKKATFDISAYAKQSMGPPKHGREYPRPGGKMHMASAPGEAPAIDTGNLANSIQVDFVGDLTGIVFTQVEYAPLLEFGGVKVAPRPFFTPAAEAKWSGFLAAMKSITGV